ncbi:hypothetical protein CEXT_565111 [Caerostris extrusa]|uniref:Uncharacterized protein n=1 Tax=Caerostris extrusa TaxID=172846 RepID=A0AAV4WRG6_CAEEX|nr:hypothetical protein CEXT_565111 [Caerostris extrusa]
MEPLARNNLEAGLRRALKPTSSEAIEPWLLILQMAAMKANCIQAITTRQYQASRPWPYYPECIKPYQPQLQAACSWLSEAVFTYHEEGFSGDSGTI